MPDGKVKKVNAIEQSSFAGKGLSRRSGNDFIQDTIFRIGRLQDHMEKAGMQLAASMPRSFFMQKDKSGGNDV